MHAFGRGQLEWLHGVYVLNGLCLSRVQLNHALGHLQYAFQFFQLTFGMRSMLNFLHCFLTPAKSSVFSSTNSVFDSVFFSELSAVACVPSVAVFFSEASAVSLAGSAIVSSSACLAPLSASLFGRISDEPVSAAGLMLLEGASPCSSPLSFVVPLEDNRQSHKHLDAPHCYIMPTNIV